MVAGNTIDIREHVMGDMLMLTGTFTDGGTDVYYGDTLSEVFAAGGHVTSLYSTGVTLNDATNIAVGDTAFAVDGVDARLHYNVGETLYKSDGTRIGEITAIGSATSITVGGGSLAIVEDDDVLHKIGPYQAAVTLNSGVLAVSIDETNRYVVFGNGNLGATSTAHTQDGRWWILGKR